MLFPTASPDIRFDPKWVTSIPGCSGTISSVSIIPQVGDSKTRNVDNSEEVQILERAAGLSGKRCKGLHAV